MRKNSKNVFIINMGIHAMVIYFALCLLINSYKNVYSHNDYLLELLLLKGVMCMFGLLVF